MRWWHQRSFWSRRKWTSYSLGQNSCTCFFHHPHSGMKNWQVDFLPSATVSGGGFPRSFRVTTNDVVPRMLLFCCPFVVNALTQWDLFSLIFPLPPFTASTLPALEYKWKGFLWFWLPCHFPERLVLQHCEDIIFWPVARSPLPSFFTVTGCSIFWA